ncbi:MAG: glycosyltransferase, partial [Chloroflexota bacterium]|nr:glycosyltransferase [Chloroflexota bacterium]
LPLVRSHHRPFFFLFPLAFESFDLANYELVISNKSAFCHGVIIPPETLHICYCLTTTRFLWDFQTYVQRERFGGLARLILPPLINRLRLWDRAATERVDHFVAISETVRRRIAKFYGRDSVVIHPPVDTTKYTPAPSHDDYFLIVSRLVPYKRIDLAVRAFDQLGLPLVIVGDGRDRTSLEEMAGPNIRFLGRLPEEEVKELMAHCRAFVFPGREDFGIAPVEAQAAGRPVIAYAAGGALDTIVEGVTGTFFHEQMPEALAEAVEEFDDTRYDPAVIRQNAERFDKSVFKEQFERFVEEKLAEHRERFC